jgi:hypothetical protein
MCPTWRGRSKEDETEGCVQDEAEGVESEYSAVRWWGFERKLVDQEEGESYEARAQPFD